MTHHGPLLVTLGAVVFFVASIWLAVTYADRIGMTIGACLVVEWAIAASCVVAAEWHRQ